MIGMCWSACGRRVARAWLLVSAVLSAAAVRAQVSVESVAIQAVASAPDLRAGDRLLAARWQGGEMALDSLAAVTLFQWQVLPRGRAEVQIERDGARRWIGWAPMSAEPLVLPAPDAAGPLAALDQGLLALRAGRAQPQSEASRAAFEAVWTLVSQTPALREWRALAVVYAARGLPAGNGDEVLRRLARLDDIAIDPVLRGAADETRVRAWMEQRRIEDIVARLGPLARLGPEVKLDAWQAQLLLRLGWARGQQGEYAQALELVSRGQSAVHALCADCLEAAIALDAEANLRSRLDQPERAYALQDQVVRTWQQLQPRSTNAALATLKLAGFAERAGDPARALDLARQSHDLLDAIEAPTYLRGAAANVLGTQLAVAGRADEAEASFRRGLAVLGASAQELAIRKQLRNNLGLLLKGAGRLAQAYAEVSGAEQEYRSHGERSGIEYAAVAANLANLERLRGDYEAAAGWLQRSLDALADAPTMGPRRAFTLIDMAELDLQRGRREEALAGFVAAQAAVAQTQAQCECRAQADLHQGRALSESDPSAALPLLERAARGFGLEGRALDVARSEAARALALSALRRPAEARAAMRAALREWRSTFPDSVEHAQALHGLGRIEDSAGRPGAAREAWCAAADVLDRASFTLGADDYAQMRFRGRFVEVYRDCMLATLDAQGAQAALDVLQRARRIAWREGSEWRARGSADPALVRLGREYERAWQSLNAPLADAEARREASERVESLRRERTQALARLAGEPGLAPAAAREPAPGELLLVYALGARRSLVFVLAHGAPVEFVELPVSRSELRTRVREWRALVARRDARDLPAIQAGGERLYRALLAPLEDRLDGHSRLAIVADDALHELPFAALWDARRGQYLIERMSVRASDGLGAPERVATEGPWLALGDATLAGVEQTPAWAWTRAAGASLAPLPGARREVESLAQRHAGVRAWLGAQASEARFKAQAAGADVLHLAVHTLADPVNPLDSALLLAPGGEDNGLLQVWEVLEQLHLRARLVVLSGCGTALGGSAEGEGVAGFVRAFRGAGAASVVASLWPTHDAATAELVQRFYAAREGAADPAAALRAAMLGMLHGTPGVLAGGDRGVGALAPAHPVQRLDHPWYWAALQVHEG